MPALIGAAIWGMVVSILQSMVGRILVYLGISYIAYRGIDALLGSLKTMAFSFLTNVPPDLLGIIGLARIGESISIITSALTAKFLLQGLTGGVLTKIGLK